MTRSCLVWLSLLAGLAGSGCALVHPVSDPAASDLSFFDEAHPPVRVEVQFEVETARPNAIVYEAQGPGPLFPNPTTMRERGSNRHLGSDS